MSKNVIKFPNSKRKLTNEEEKIIRQSANLIHNTYINNNPFIKPKEMTEETLKELIQDIFELNED
jgi:hypothetical protein|tara:strand:- start:908 stop:1102 length:195 start_codon:yes stop_codon:yes gene_type:complete